MKTLLTHLVLNVSALNSNTPALVLTATNEPGSFQALETLLYGADGLDEPDYETYQIDVPAHVAKLLTSHQAVVGYLAAKLGEVIGEDIAYGVEIVLKPGEQTSYCYGITPPNVATYSIDQEQAEGEERRPYFTFQQALHGAEMLKRRETHNLITITPYNAQGEVIGDDYVYYDEVK
jgi:hypothetical protein